MSVKRFAQIFEDLTAIKPYVTRKVDSILGLSSYKATPDCRQITHVSRTKSQTPTPFSRDKTLALGVLHTCSMGPCRPGNDECFFFLIFFFAGMAGAHRTRVCAKIQDQSLKPAWISDS